MSLKLRESAIYALKPAADYSGNVGKLCTDDGVTATLSASATVPATTVILEAGKDANSLIEVGVLGAIEGTVKMKAGGIINPGQRVAQNNDGTVIADAGPGNARVVVGKNLETVACAAGDLIEVAPFTPMILP